MSGLFFKINEKLSKLISRISLLFISYYKYYNILPKDLRRIKNDEIVKKYKSLKRNNKFLSGKIIKIKLNCNSFKIIVFYKKRSSFIHMSDIATSGLDLYEVKDEKYYWLGTISPKNCFSMKAFKKINLNPGVHELKLYLPSFAEISHIYVKTDSNISPVILDDNVRVVAYGSSITQGCAASRPALSYINLLSRYLNCDILNLGFSEGARAENEVIKYLANIETQCYLIEYDHNSDYNEFLARYDNIYRTIREKNKNCKIILLSRISGGISISEKECENRNLKINSVITRARNNGDKNIWYVNGNEIIDSNKDLYLVDDRHPNDMGMRLIADNIVKYIKEGENL